MDEKIIITDHAKAQAAKRKFSLEKVEDTAANGEESPARDGCVKKKKLFDYLSFNQRGKWFKQVVVECVCAISATQIIVITVISRFKGRDQSKEGTTGED